MDSRVNAFFNEINEIVPPFAQVRSTSECVWQECFDDTTGYPYYWNMLTNAVTWEVPSEYEEWLHRNKKTSKQTNAAGDGVEAKPLFPSAAKNTNFASGESKIVTTSALGQINEEKLYLIEKDTDSREAAVLNRNGLCTNSPLHSNNSKSNSQANSDNETTDDIKTKSTLGFSLLANYGNYSDEDEDSPNEEHQQSSHTLVAEGHSTLFPVTEPIDVTQFAEVESKVVREVPSTEEEIDVKAFKRKRRIGVHLVNHPKREVTTENQEKLNGEELKEKEDSLKKYSMNFVKGDTLVPLSSTNVEEKENGDKDSDEVEETQKTLKEKLAFLSEGRETISPVQVMTVQLEILFTAWKLGHLDTTYFTSWIKDVCSDLIKLEEEATPEGWNLEWDRQEKRYFYRNKATDECQWQYPEQSDADVVDGTKKDEDDDAMDICTTPPPAHADATQSNIEVTTISAVATDDYLKGQEKDLSMTQVLDSFYSDIAAIETAAVETVQNNKEEVNEEGKAKSRELPGGEGDVATVEPPKKKKKVKIAHGIAMKKKGVSQLVEKWKNLQKDLE